MDVVQTNSDMYTVKPDPNLIPGKSPVHSSRPASFHTHSFHTRANGRHQPLYEDSFTGGRRSCPWSWVSRHARELVSTILPWSDAGNIRWTRRACDRGVGIPWLLSSTCGEPTLTVASGERVEHRGDVSDASSLGFSDVP